LNENDGIYDLIQALYRLHDSTIVETNWKFASLIQDYLLKNFNINTHKLPTKDSNVFSLIPDSIQDERTIRNEFCKVRHESDTSEEELIF
jgi:hypothetical protein